MNSAPISKEIGTYALSFIIQGLPKMTNEMARGGWKKRQGEANKWKRLVWRACWHLKPSTPLMKAKLKLTRHSSSEPDFDGLCAGFKHVIDGLVEAGVLVNDRRENIGQPAYEWSRCAPKNGFITVEVREV